MYIDPFVAGVAATIIAELMIVMLAVAVYTAKEMKREKQRKCKNR